MLCHVSSSQCIVCSLSVYGPRATRGDTTRERECCSSCQPHLPLATEPGCSGECKLLILIAPLIPHLVCLRYVPDEWWKISWIQGEKVCFRCPLDAANTGNSPSADPADWPLHVTDLMRTELVWRGLYHVTPDFIFPFCVFIIEQVYLFAHTVMLFGLSLFKWMSNSLYMVFGLFSWGWNSIRKARLGHQMV